MKKPRNGDTDQPHEGSTSHKESKPQRPSADVAKDFIRLGGTVLVTRLGDPEIFTGCPIEVVNEAARRRDLLGAWVSLRKGPSKSVIDCLTELILLNLDGDGGE